MATQRPMAVAMSASPTPPVMAVGCPDSRLNTENEVIMPLIVPLADLIGLTRQSVVLAFCFGDGFTNVFFPTNAMLLIVLGMMDIPYTKWFKWTWKLQLAVLILTALLLIFAVSAGYA